nr:uncharacterized protein LOC109169255 isoform X3 [Ipomoea batatas]
MKEILFSPPCKKDMKSALSTFRRNFIGGWRKKATRRKSYPRYKAKSGASNAAEEEEVDDVLAWESELHEVPIYLDPAIEDLSKTLSIVVTEKAPSEVSGMHDLEGGWYGGDDDLTTLLNIDEDDMTELDYAAIALRCPWMTFGSPSHK